MRRRSTGARGETGMAGYDYVIIGGGSAGCVLAARLSEDPAATVCLLEAGGANTETLVRMPAGVGSLIKGRNKHNWGFWTEPEPHLDNRRLYWPRGKGLGGSSAINGMVYMRGHPLDYDEWRQFGLAGWSWDDVLPYFRRLERHPRGRDPPGRAGSRPFSPGRSCPPVLHASGPRELAPLLSAYQPLRPAGLEGRSPVPGVS